MSPKKDLYKLQFSSARLRAKIASLHPDQNLDKAVKWYMEALIGCLESISASIGLTEPEARLIVNSFEETEIQSSQVQSIDRLAVGLIFFNADPSADVDPILLTQKLKSLSACQRLALCDGINRYWEAPPSADGARARLIEIGLIKPLNAESIN